jgi:hypothetical protein
MKYFAVLGVLALAAACGSKKEPGVFVVPGGGSGGASGSNGHAGRGGASSGIGGAAEGGEAGANEGSSLAPIVKITSPAAVDDPNIGPVVLDVVHVVCVVTPGSSPGATVAASSVSIEAVGADGKSIQKTVGTVSVSDPTQFTSDFTLNATAAPNGPISFKCSASDSSSPPNTGSAIVDTFIDHGPNITAILPPPPRQTALQYYELGVVPFEFTVTPASLSAADDQSAVDQVTLSINNVPIDISSAENPKKKGTYSGEVNLGDPVLFKTTPNGPVSVGITATNKRTPVPSGHSGVKATASYDFGVDGQGPQITITSPSTADGVVVGRLVNLVFTVNDTQSGVDLSTLTVKLNSQEIHIFDPTQWGHDGNKFTFTIPDTTAVAGSTVQLQVDIEVSDLAKNHALAATAQYWIDTNPPIVDLDPEKLEEVDVNSGKCSEPFDPLGDSPNDGDVVKSLSIFRALVWDQTNPGDGAKVLHYSGTDVGSVRLYAQADPSQPLLIAAHNTDGVCDEIATAGTANVTTAPVPFQLGPLGQVGSSYFGPGATAIAGLCTVGAAGAPPPKLCKGISSLSRIINHDVGPREDVVYTVTSTVDLECTGKDLDLSASLPNGWVCLAARGVDYAGNVGVSAPIRVCLNSINHPTPACANSSVDIPTCVASCTPPGHFVGISPASPVHFIRYNN